MDKENLEYMECLYEMATVRPLSSLDSFGILLAINPDTNNGDAYFKMYNSTSFYNATTVWRIKFEKAEFIKEHKGKIKNSIVMNSDLKSKLIKYLNANSKDFKGYTIWDELRYRWNTEKDLMNQFGFNDYVSGIVDKYYENKDTKGNYVPYNMQMPDYNKL